MLYSLEGRQISPGIFQVRPAARDSGQDYVGGRTKWKLMARIFGPVFIHGGIGFHFHGVPFVMIYAMFAFNVKAVSFEVRVKPRRKSQPGVSVEAETDKGLKQLTCRPKKPCSSLTYTSNSSLAVHNMWFRQCLWNFQLFGEASTAGIGSVYGRKPSIKVPSDKGTTIDAFRIHKLLQAEIYGGNIQRKPTKT
jgi:hypothetical protein